MVKKKEVFKDFVHLHVHSHYSLLDGLGKIDDLIKQAKKLGMKALALTDHGVMYGAIEFFQKAKEAGIKPIIGCEVYLAANGMQNKQPRTDEERFHLVLLAKNQQGYQNLLKIVTAGHLEGFYYKPRVDLNFLSKNSEGLFALSACLAGEVARSVVRGGAKKTETIIKKYQKIFGKDNFFLELEPHQNSPEQEKVNQVFLDLSKKLEVPLVATSDAHYVFKEDKEIQDVLVCIQQNKKVEDKNRLKMTDFDLFLRSPQEMQIFFKNIPEALENTVKIAEQCNFYPEMGKIILPEFQIPEKKSADEFLEEWCLKGIKERYASELTKIATERLEFELGVIKKMGYASYFLIVADFVNWAKNNKIVVGPGRGSAAGSIVSYLTKITNIDPIKYDLLFERFLNPERISMPDIDIDFADDRRDEVINYVENKYGKDKVAQIITFGTMAARAAIRDAGRALNFPYKLCDQIAKEIPAFTKLKEALKKSVELAKMYKDDAGVKKIVDTAIRLEGVVRHASTHACGVVITKDPLVKYVPLQRSTKGNKDGVVTQFEGKSIEALGLLKMDFLGLKNLTILQNVIEIIYKRHKKEYTLDQIPMDDQKTLLLFAKGETTGVFQFESSGFKRYLKELQPTRFQDLIDMVALYRPGPMEWIPEYIAGKNGKRKITYLHPKLQPILEKTYGIIVVQEQVMEIAKRLAGFSAGEADYLRKAMGKKIPKLMDEQREKFLNGCVKNGIDKGTAEKIWEFITPFAGYGFNWAHSACYAMIGYQTAYFKAYYPAEFMAALLKSDENNTDRITVEIEECRKMGIPVLPPDVNESFSNFAVVNNKEGKPVIRYGLKAIKNVGVPVSEAIISARKQDGYFKDLEDFMMRVECKDLNKKSLEALSKSGALSSISRQEEILANVDDILSYAKEIRSLKKRGQKSLFGGGTQDNQSLKINLEKKIVIEKKERLSWEKELLGIYVSENPLSDYLFYLKAKTQTVADLEKMAKEKGNGSIKVSNYYNQNTPYPLREKKEIVKVGGIISKVKKIYTKNNQEMLFAEIEDLTGKLEVIVFPKLYAKNPKIWEEDKVVWVEGELDTKEGNLKVLGKEVGEITNRMKVVAKELEEKTGDNKKACIPLKKIEPQIKKENHMNKSNNKTIEQKIELVEDSRVENSDPLLESETIQVFFQSGKDDFALVKRHIERLKKEKKEVILEVKEKNNQCSLLKF